MNTLLASEPGALLQLLGRLHPLMVHFPVGLLMVAAVLEVWCFIQRRGPHSSPGAVCLVMGTFGAIAAAGCGWINAWVEIGATTSDAVELHRWLGVACAGLCLLTLASLVRVVRTGRGTMVYRMVLIGAALLVAIAGHEGGKLTHGEDYVSSAVDRIFGREKPAPQPTAPVASGSIVYRQYVVPILEKHCYECHGEKKAKGRLRVDSVAAMLKGGKTGSSIIPGDGVHSDLVKRVNGTSPLPQMPLDADPLTPEQIAILTAWIEGGAKE